MLRNLLIVAVGGSAGSVLRYLLSVWMPRPLPGDFPWATLAVNLAGSFLIGLCIGRIAPDEQSLRLLLVTGFCGGFTTFSAFAYENVQLMQAGQYTLALAYTISTMLFGIALVMAGIWTSESI